MFELMFGKIVWRHTIVKYLQKEQKFKREIMCFLEGENSSYMPSPFPAPV